jgi:hypothetical protein
LEIEESKKRGKEMTLVLFLIFIYLQYSLLGLTISLIYKIPITFLIIVAISIFEGGKIRINAQRVLVFLLLLLCISVSWLINGIRWDLEVNSFFSLFFAFLFTCVIDSKKFFCYYCKGIIFLSFTGVFIFIFSIIVPSFFTNFNIIADQSWTNAPIRNVFFGNVLLDTNFKRNMGIFAEPGIFAFHINFALFLMLFVLKNINPKLIIILLCASVSTLSTSGLIVTSLILLAFYITKKSKFTYKENKKIFFVIVCLLLGVLLFMFKNQAYYEFLIGKLFEINNSSTSGSGYERFQAFKYTLSAISENPIFGVAINGWIGLLSGNIGTFTPFNWVAYYGIIYGVICNVLYFKTVFLHAEKKTVQIILCVALIALIVSQNVSSYIIIYAVIFYNISENQLEKTNTSKVSFELQEKRYAVYHYGRRG